MHLKFCYHWNRSKRLAWSSTIYKQTNITLMIKVISYVFIWISTFLHLNLLIYCHKYFQVDINPIVILKTKKMEEITSKADFLLKLQFNIIICVYLFCIYLSHISEISTSISHHKIHIFENHYDVLDESSYF